MMRAALARARVNPTDVDYVNAHGTSTPLGDLAETKALKDVFGDHALRARRLLDEVDDRAICFGAAGAIEAMMCVLAIHDGVIPPTINYEHPDPECDLDYVPNEAREANVERRPLECHGPRRPQRVRALRAAPTKTGFRRLTRCEVLGSRRRHGRAARRSTRLGRRLRPRCAHSDRRHSRRASSVIADATQDGTFDIVTANALRPASASLPGRADGKLRARRLSISRRAAEPRSARTPDDFDDDGSSRLSALATGNGVTIFAGVDAGVVRG